VEDYAEADEQEKVLVKHMPASRHAGWGVMQSCSVCWAAQVGWAGLYTGPTLIRQPGRRSQHSDCCLITQRVRAVMRAVLAWTSKRYSVL
jgi:cytochrome c2